MNGKIGYEYKQGDGGIIITGLKEIGSDIFIPHDWDGQKVVGFKLASDQPLPTTSLTIDAELTEYYTHSKQLPKLAKITFGPHSGGKIELIRKVIDNWIYKNRNCKATLPELIIEAKPIDYIVKNQVFYLSPDGKTLLLAYTRESIDIPYGITTIGSHAIVSTYKKTSTIKYPKSVIKLEDNAIDMSMEDYYAYNGLPSSVKEIGRGLLLCSSFSPKICETANIPFKYEYPNLYINGTYETVSDEALKELSRYQPSFIYVDPNSKCFEFKDGLLIYKKDTAVCAVKKKKNDIVIVPSYIKTSFLNGTRSSVFGNRSVVEQSKETAKEKSDKPEFAPIGNGCYRLSNEINLEKLVIKPDMMPMPKSRKKVPDCGFALTDECKDLKELELSEGVTSLELSAGVDLSSFKIEILILPSTVTVSRVLPELRRMKSLMLLVIKPIKKIQQKYNDPGYHFIIANAKKKMSSSLFYSYSSYNADWQGDSMYASGPNGGLSYISHFKREKYLHYQSGHYYLVEDEDGSKHYWLVKTDFVDNFVVPSSINGIDVKYQDRFAFSNCKSYSSSKSLELYDN